MGYVGRAQFWYKLQQKNGEKKQTCFLQDRSYPSKNQNFRILFWNVLFLI